MFLTITSRRRYQEEALDYPSHVPGRDSGAAPQRDPSQVCQASVVVWRHGGLQVDGKLAGLPLPIPELRGKHGVGTSGKECFQHGHWLEKSGTIAQQWEMAARMGCIEPVCRRIWLLLLLLRKTEE